MVKKRGNKTSEQKQAGKNKKITKKRQQQESDEDEIQQQSEGSNSMDIHSSQYMDSQDISEQDSQNQDQSSSSSVQVKPENFAIREMKFRERRGTKMTALMNRKKQQEDDPFWQQYGANVFGNLEDGDQDAQDYVESSSGKDIFDSDFGQTESEHEDEEQAEEKKFEQNQEKQKQRKRQAQLLKKLNAGSDKKKTKPKIAPKRSRSDKPYVEKSRYIHQQYCQEELLAEAANTEYENWLSLKKLISIETEKKDFTRKEKHIEGEKIIYQDKLTEGERRVKYELVGIEAPEVKDITEIWSKK